MRRGRRLKGLALMLILELCKVQWPCSMHEWICVYVCVSVTKCMVCPAAKWSHAISISLYFDLILSTESVCARACVCLSVRVHVHVCFGMGFLLCWALWRWESAAVLSPLHTPIHTHTLYLWSINSESWSQDNCFCFCFFWSWFLW